MRKGIAIFLLLGGMAMAQQAKLTDAKTFQVANDSFLGRWAASDGGSAVIPATRQVVSLTLVLDETQYVANFMASKHLIVVVGDPVQVRIDKDKLFIKGDNGKELRGTIIRREHLTSPAASPQSASR